MKKEQPAPLVWLWEFSKKVVTTAFLLYVIAFIYMIITSYEAMKLVDDATALSTFISEQNETFRVVVGGYMLKAGGENIAKIVTAYLQKGKLEDSNQKEELEEAHDEVGQG